MNTTEAVRTLREHNRWRRAEAPEIPDGIPDTSPPHSARDIGIAIDVLCNEVERLHKNLERTADICSRHAERAKREGDEGVELGALRCGADIRFMLMPHNDLAQGRPRPEANHDE